MKHKHIFLILMFFTIIFSSCIESIVEKHNLTFVNNVFTPIKITVNGETETIQTGSSTTFNNIETASVSYNAYTKGNTSDGSQVGLRIIWSDNVDLNQTNKTINLNLSEKYFYLSITNRGEKYLNKLYVNYDLESETIDNIEIPNNNSKYGIGYYKAWSNTKIKAYKKGTTTFVYWEQGSQFYFSGTENQKISLICTH